MSLNLVFNLVRVFEEEGDCILCLEIRADELMRRLISGELTKYRVVRTSPEPLQIYLPIDCCGLCTQHRTQEHRYQYNLRCTASNVYCLQGYSYICKAMRFVEHDSF